MKKKLTSFSSNNLAGFEPESKFALKSSDGSGGNNNDKIYRCMDTDRHLSADFKFPVETLSHRNACQWKRYICNFTFVPSVNSPYNSIPFTMVLYLKHFLPNESTLYECRTVYSWWRYALTRSRALAYLCITLHSVNWCVQFVL